MLTFADEDRCNDISYIPYDREILVGHSLDENDLTATIGEIKEEDDEESSDSGQSSKSLKIESLTNESTCYRS
jgi:hypothetical protein